MSCGGDVGDILEVELDEPVVNPGTTTGTVLGDALDFSCRFWFHSLEYPCSSMSVPSD